MKYAKRLLYLLVFVLIAVGCNLPAIQPATEIPPTVTKAAPTVTPEPAQHRIGVRVVDGVGEFYDWVTNEKFVPRGNNYVRLDPQKTSDGSMQIYHSVFDPGLYNRTEIEKAFQEMHADGYNTVRVFISQNTIGTSGGLNTDYMDNIIDFLQLAKGNELYVIITQDWLPGGKYGSILNGDCCDTFNMMNIHFLSSAGLEANKAYFQDFVRYLMDHHAALDAVFSYELRNELFFDTNFPPLSLTSGMVTGANGNSYDMSKDEDKKKMVDENMVYWMDSIRASILDLDPTALVSVGFFTPQEPNPARIGDERYINTQPAILNSQLDFIDLHPYPASELTLKQYVENFGMQDVKEKPIIMGEFGVSTQGASTVDQAAKILMNWQADSCQYGFDGWLLWSWDIHENNDFYSAKSGDSQIEKILAPVNRPDPCETGQFDFIETNVALNTKVTASHALKDQPTSNAVDGTDAQWGSGKSPKQWILLDLGKPYLVKKIRLTVGQYPDGNTVHTIEVRGPKGSNYLLVYTFDGFTKDSQVLEFKPAIPIANVQFIRITTVSSPSWVSWKEIEVITP